MKKLLSIFVIAVSLFTTSAYAELKAAFINSATILQEAPQAKAAVEAMKKEFKEREDALRAMAEEIKKEEKDLQKDGAIMSPEQKQKKENAVMEKKRKLRFDAQSLKEDVDLRRKQEIEKIRASISEVINKYSKKHGYDLVFTQGVAFAADKVNITQDILKELKK
jgi:outer membrane protein